MVRYTKNFLIFLISKHKLRLSKKPVKSHELREGFLTILLHRLILKYDHELKNIVEIVSKSKMMN